MKNILVVALLVVSSWFIFSQDQSPSGKDPVNSFVVEVRLSGFEDASLWDIAMSPDEGVISKATLKGAPKDLTDEDGPMIKRDKQFGIPNTYDKEKVLGIKVQYLRRGYNVFSIKPVKPIAIEGICESISVWIAGRNYKHTLKIIVKDFMDKDRIVYVDKLDFSGWRELLVSIPLNIKQYDYHFGDRRGIKFNGFVVECDFLETYGTYYVYFDELRAKTDVFMEYIRDADDMQDDW